MIHSTVLKRHVSLGISGHIPTWEMEWTVREITMEGWLRYCAPPSLKFEASVYVARNWTLDCRPMYLRVYIIKNSIVETTVIVLAFGLPPRF